MATLMNFIAGVVFGIGLVISGMSDPAKVTNFLDIAGQWDPSLAFVMAGAVGVTAVGYALVRRRLAPMFASAFEMPASSDINAPLIMGSGLFGIGWGLFGYCPGPAITSLAIGGVSTIVFVVAMCAGAACASVLWRGGRDD